MTRDVTIESFGARAVRVAPAHTVSYRAVRLLSRLVLYLVLTVGCVIVLFPVIWMVSTSLKPNEYVFEYPPRVITDQVLWENYPRALDAFPFFLYLRNSLIITGVATFGTVLSSSLVAFGFARRRFPERGFLFGVLLSDTDVRALHQVGLGEYVSPVDGTSLFRWWCLQHILAAPVLCHTSI